MMSKKSSIPNIYIKEDKNFYKVISIALYQTLEKFFKMKNFE